MATSFPGSWTAMVSLFCLNICVNGLQAGPQLLAFQTFRGKEVSCSCNRKWVCIGQLHRVAAGSPTSPVYQHKPLELILLSFFSVSRSVVDQWLTMLLTIRFVHTASPAVHQIHFRFPCPSTDFYIGFSYGKL